MPKMLPGGSGNSWLVFTAMSAPVLELTEEAQLPSSSKLKNPPGHKPSFPLSTFITVSPRPPYCHAPFIPPSTTPCPTCVMFTSKVMPLSASWWRTPHQSPVRVERDQMSPEYGSLGAASCAATRALRDNPSSNITVVIIVDLFIATPVLTLPVSELREIHLNRVEPCARCCDSKPI